jgi:hypothetical protein
LLWALYAGVVRFSGPVPAGTGLLSHLMVPGLLLLPVFGVLATGVRLGWRTGSVFAGLLAGALASLVLTLIYSATRLVVTWSALLAEARAGHASLWLELVAAIFFDLLTGAIFLLLGMGLGSLGACIGIQWHQRGQLVWRALLRITAAKVSR